MSGTLSIDDLANGDLSHLVISEHAHKHGVKDDDIRYVILYPDEVILMELDPDEKWLFFGLDTALRELQVIVVVKRDGQEIVTHAMKVTKKILDLISEIRHG
jgi:hypothetical protein